MSKTIPQKSSNDQTLNYAVFYTFLYIAGYLTGIFYKVLFQLFRSPKRHCGSPLPKNNEDTLTTPAYLRKSGLSAPEWEKRQATELSSWIKSTDYDRTQTSLSPFNEDDFLLAQELYEENLADDQISLEMVYELNFSIQNEGDLS